MNVSTLDQMLAAITQHVSFKMVPSHDWRLDRSNRCLYYNRRQLINADTRPAVGAIYRNAGIAMHSRSRQRPWEIATTIARVINRRICTGIATARDIFGVIATLEEERIERIQRSRYAGLGRRSLPPQHTDYRRDAFLERLNAPQPTLTMSFVGKRKDTPWTSTIFGLLARVLEDEAATSADERFVNDAVRRAISGTTLDDLLAEIETISIWCARTIANAAANPPSQPQSSSPRQILIRVRSTQENESVEIDSTSEMPEPEFTITDQHLEDILKARGDVVYGEEDLIKALFAQTPGLKDSGAAPGDPEFSDTTLYSWPSVRSVSYTIAAPLERALRKLRPNRAATLLPRSRKGSLVTRYAIGESFSPAPSGRIFTQRIPIERRRYAMHLLVDVSGSMEWSAAGAVEGDTAMIECFGAAGYKPSRAHLATVLCGALLEVGERFPEITLGVSRHHSKGEIVAPQVTTHSLDVREKTINSFSPQGTTDPLAGWVVARDAIACDTAPKKVIIHLSDGDFPESEHITEILASLQARSIGLVIFLLGAPAESVPASIPREMIVPVDLSTLPYAIEHHVVPLLR